MWRPPAHRNTLVEFIIKSNSKAICIQFNVKMVNHRPNLSVNTAEPNTKLINGLVVHCPQKYSCGDHLPTDKYKLTNFIYFLGV